MTVRDLIEVLKALPDEQQDYLITTWQERTGQYSATKTIEGLHGGSVAPMRTIVIVGNGF